MKQQTLHRLEVVFRRIPKTRKPTLADPRRPTWITDLALEQLEDRSLMAAVFFAPAEPAGNLTVQLVPLANVAAGAEEIVTFGVPFSRGSVTAAQLSQLRVLKGGVEISAFVEQLTPWRSIDDAGIDGQSVRVARIQIPYTFAAIATESITVQWGGPARTLNRANLQDPRLEWHQVTTGTFVAADNVEEPDVLPVLSKEHLSKGLLDARTVPTASSVAPTRDDPAVMDAMSFTGYTEYDYAQKNFFYTTINQNPGITINYKTDPEPWLYDRSSAMYELYLRSGFSTALREAVRSADFYADRLNASGFFTLRAGDPKYAYNESLAYTYWLLGDNRMLAPISTVVNAHAGTATRWNPNLGFWTERNVGYKLLANEIAYEVTGNTTFKNNVQTIVNDLVYHQNGAAGQLPANRIDGGLYHIGAQHDASEVEDPNVIIASPWMSALIVDPLVRVYGVWQNSQIADFLVRMGNFEKAASKTDSDGEFGGTLRYSDYLMRADGTTEARTASDVQHAMDVGGVAAWATYFAELRGTPDASLRQLASDLYATYDAGVNYWTRPGGTNFNVSPPRRYSWEYKNSPHFSWALTGSAASRLVGAYIFYNNSKFDGNNPAAAASDDAAIATDKTALLPGTLATLSHYTSYSRGINGVMVDIQNQPLALLSAADFEFRVGNDSNVNAWTLAPAPAAIHVRTAVGSGGSQRATITWPDSAIKNTWLQVTVKANSATGLAAPAVFYFGNSVGESGNSAANALVNSTDEIGARTNPQTFITPATINDRFDFNRDGFVNATDQILARSHSTTVATALQLISVPAGLQATVASAASVLLSDNSIAMGLVAPTASSRSFPARTLSTVPKVSSPKSATVATECLTPSETRPASRAPLIDSIALESNQEEQLYELIASELVNSKL